MLWNFPHFHPRHTLTSEVGEITMEWLRQLGNDSLLLQGTESWFLHCLEKLKCTMHRLWLTMEITFKNERGKVGREIDLYWCYRLNCFPFKIYMLNSNPKFFRRWNITIFEDAVYKEVIKAKWVYQDGC